MTQKVDVAFGLAFIQLINVVIKNQTLKYLGILDISKEYQIFFDIYITLCFIISERKESDHEK